MFVSLADVPLKSEEKLVPEMLKKGEKLERNDKIPKENRVKYVVKDDDDMDLNKHVKLFQRLLRGRAYQTMVKMDFTIKLGDR